MSTTPSGDLPEPKCRLGYTTAQIEDLVGDRQSEFNDWMYGQTVALCDGRRYNHEAREYEETGCGPHGLVVYPHDVGQFLRGGHPFD